MCNGPGALLLVRLRGSIFWTFIFGIVLVRLLWMFSPTPLTLLLVLYLLSIVHWRAVDGGFLLVMVLLQLVALQVCLYLLFSLFPRSRSTPFCCLRISLLLIVLSSLPLFLVFYTGHVPGVSCFCLMLIVLSLISPGKLHMEFFTLLIVLLPLVTLFSCLVFVILRLNLSIIFSSNAQHH